MDVTSLSGTVPSDSAYSLFRTGDTVVATSLGGAGEKWISIAKLYNGLPSGEYVTDLVGDPAAIPTPFVGSYVLDLFTTPDCTTCYGTTCKAISSTVNLLIGDSRVMVKTLEPRQALFYNGKNDGSSIEVTFVKGEALSETCVSGRSGMTGPQPVSVYIVKAVPPLGFSGQPAETATTIPTVPTTVPTTKAGSALPLVVTGAIGLGIILIASRR